MHIYYMELILKLKALSKIVADDIIFFVLFSRENKTWHFMWSICKVDDSHTVSNRILDKKKKKKKQQKKKHTHIKEWKSEYQFPWQYCKMQGLHRPS